MHVVNLLMAMHLNMIMLDLTIFFYIFNEILETHDNDNMNTTDKYVCTVCTVQYVFIYLHFRNVQICGCFMGHFGNIFRVFSFYTNLASMVN